MLQRHAKGVLTSSHIDFDERSSCLISVRVFKSLGKRSVMKMADPAGESGWEKVVEEMQKSGGGRRGFIVAARRGEARVGQAQAADTEKVDEQRPP
jgi:hypothetical protein